MKTNNEWKNYQLLATGNGEKLENFANNILLRPDPQVIWQPPYDLETNSKLSAVYKRSAKGGGQWDYLGKVDDKFYVNWRKLIFECKLMGFKHIGVFPEQSVNWARMIETINKAKRPIRVLNLFAYTGGATLACLSAGASVCHVDSAKSMCEMAKKNVGISNLDEKKVRFIVDDCLKFVEREIRRGNKYDAIIMDPPSYGRGPNGEMWKLEDNIFNLVNTTKEVMSDNPLFYLINSYTTGLQPTVMKNILDIVFKENTHIVDADEIGLESKDGITLPCGCSAYMEFQKK
ncbi:MAG: class I SAM-dependent methyltransferase [Clostridia bacterium]